MFVSLDVMWCFSPPPFEEQLNIKLLIHQCVYSGTPPYYHLVIKFQVYSKMFNIKFKDNTNPQVARANLGG